MLEGCRPASPPSGRAHSGFGPIVAYDVLRVLVPSLTAVAVAAQLSATAFLTSLLTIRS